MPRVGRNPLKDTVTGFAFPPVLTTVITHLPNETGYHEQRFQIVKRCLETMRTSAPVLVWDNGSCSKLRNWLTKKYKPEYLVLSGNVGKQSAMAAISRMLPPDTLVTFSDDDMEYSDGWLDASLELYNAFPNVGMVSTWAVRVSFVWGNAATVKWAKENAAIESGLFIPLDEVRDYYRSTGGEANGPDHQYEHVKDLRITHKGLTAYAAAQHCSFLTRAGTFAPFTEYLTVGMGNEKPLDEAVDAAGLLRLTTTKQYSRHMGNRL
jgi:hypothetical protein